MALRCAVLLLVALLAIDASWCCDDVTATDTRALRAAPAGGDEAPHVECDACICSGHALLVGSSAPVPPLATTLAAAPASSPPVNHAGTVEIPPDERA